MTRPILMQHCTKDNNLERVARQRLEFWLFEGIKVDKMGLNFPGVIMHIWTQILRGPPIIDSRWSTPNPLVSGERLQRFHEGQERNKTSLRSRTITQMITECWRSAKRGGPTRSMFERGVAMMTWT